MDEMTSGLKLAALAGGGVIVSDRCLYGLERWLGAAY